MTLSRSTIKPLNVDWLRSVTSARDGETKLGQDLTSFDGSASVESFLTKCAESGVKFALIGVPEDIGPRANLGRGGAKGAWEAFLGQFANIQANQMFDHSHLAVLGAVDLGGIEEKSADSPAELRKLCEEIDEHVAAAVETIVKHGLEPIVIGGGHNNALPIMRGIVRARSAVSNSTFKLGCANLDVHLDFRRIEGRHSGNPFRYAYEEKLLHAYFALGTKDSYNSAESIESLRRAGFHFVSYEDLFVRCCTTLDSAVDAAVNYFLNSSCFVGIELDLDSINGLPASNPVVGGFTLEQGTRYIFSLSSRLPCAYLHLPEGAPAHAPDGERIVGRALLELVLAYVKGRAHCCLL